MDGSVSASTQSVERLRQNLAQAFSQRSTSRSGQGSLFEQLLNIPAAIKSRPDRGSAASCAPEPATFCQALNHSTTKKKVSEEDKDELSSEDHEAVPAAAAAHPAQPLNVHSDGLTAPLPEGEREAMDSNGDLSDADHETVGETNSHQRSMGSEGEESLSGEKEIEAATSESTSEWISSSSESLAPAMAGPEGSAENGQNEAIELLNASQLAQQEQHRHVSQKSAVGSSIATASGVDADDESNPPPATSEARNDSTSGRRTLRREKWFENNTDSASHLDSTATANTSANSSPSETQSKSEQLAQVMQEMAPSLGLELTEVQSQLAQATAIAMPAPGVGGTSTVVATSDPANALADDVVGSVRGASPSVANSTSGTSGTSGTTTTAKAGTTHSVDQPEPTQQERVRLIQRIARSFNRITPDGGQINLRLHPQNLGSLNMQVRIEGRSLSAKMTTETNAARDAILQDLPVLRQRLADQGYDVTKFQVEVAGSGADTAFAQSGGQMQYDPSSSGQSGNRSASFEPDYRRIASRNARLQSTPVPIETARVTAAYSAGIDVQA
jgi:flagellar hook-length control protein FliK